LDGDQYGNEAAPFLQQQAKIGQELSLITAQQKIITEDIEEELNTQNELDVRKKRRGNENEPGLDFFERAYAATIIPKIMSATAKHKKRRFDTSEFRGNVLTAYNAVTVKGGAQLAWCHITGEWYEGDVVKAAHLVPKSLHPREVGYLFGLKEASEDFLYDWRLGISLYKNLEGGLDNGTIVIVPIIPSANPTRWKCLLVDESKRALTALATPHKLVRWGDLDQKELVFRGDKRPAKRYLYFRFIITIINAQRANNTPFLQRLEGKEVFWASPGSYLRRSTLVSLARNISGLELPPSQYNETTFEETELDARRDQDAAAQLAVQLRNATVESSKEQ